MCWLTVVCCCCPSNILEFPFVLQLIMAKYCINFLTDSLYLAWTMLFLSCLLFWIGGCLHFIFLLKYQFPFFSFLMESSKLFIQNWNRKNKSYISRLRCLLKKNYFNKKQEQSPSNLELHLVSKRNYENNCFLFWWIKQQIIQFVNY